MERQFFAFNTFMKFSHHLICGGGCMNPRPDLEGFLSYLLSWDL